MNPNDNWLQSVDEAFRSAFDDEGHDVMEPPETYNSQDPTDNNVMNGILRNICLQQPEVVYFAGRTPALVSFVQALPGRPCPKLTINIIAGADAVEFVTKVSRNDDTALALRAGLNANASVQYTGQAHPESWKASPESFSAESKPRFSDTCEYCFKTLFPSETLEDAGAIIGHDAIVTAVTAIRQGSKPNYEPRQITQWFQRLHDIDAIPGASGWISLDPFGKPRNKAVPILQLNPDGTLKFLKLSSPHASGQPCVPRTTVLDTPLC